MSTVRILSSAVEVHVQELVAGGSRNVWINVDHNGHVGLRLVRHYTESDYERLQRMHAIYLWLSDLGLIELHPIGPENSEYFLTEAGREALRSELESLMIDWKVFDAGQA